MKYIIVLLVLFSSCSKSVYVERKMGKAYIKDPLLACAFANQLCPMKIIDTVTNVRYVEGVKIVTIDTVLVDCDSIVKAAKNDPKVITKYVQVKCPPSIKQVDTFTKETSVTKVNTYERDLAIQRADKAEKRLSEVISVRNKLWGVSGLLFALIAIRLVVKYFFKI